MHRKILATMIVASMILVMGMGICEANPAEDAYIYHIADQSEGIRLMLSNDEFFDRLSQNDLDFRMQKKGASVDEYKVFAGEQVRDFTDEQKAIIVEHMNRINKVIAGRGYQIPEMEQIVFINTTMQEECGCMAYTHGTQIYINGEALVRKSRKIKVQNIWISSFPMNYSTV